MARCSRTLLSCLFELVPYADEVINHHIVIKGFGFIHKQVI
jgi:hypothetical protein